MQKHKYSRIKHSRKSGSPRFANKLLDTTPKSWSIKKIIIKKLDFSNLKSFTLWKSLLKERKSGLRKDKSYKTIIW